MRSQNVVYVEMKESKNLLFLIRVWILRSVLASGLANARKVMEQVKNGEAEYHLIEDHGLPPWLYHGWRTAGTCR